MAHRLLRDPEADGWERSDFPIICETCLGPNPFVRMQRIAYGGECHISGRPYTVFRWRPGNDARYKKTIICQEVAKAKNVCQVCLLDLDYGLPVQVRDEATGAEKDDVPESDVGKEYQLNEREKRGTTESSYGNQRPNEMLMKLARTAPYYKRNRAQICSFFVRGECKRGAECPYRHEMPTTGDLAEQNIRDRYYGVNDPVAKRMLNRAGEMPKLEVPEDTSITTLYLGGLTPDITQDDIRDKVYSFGEVQSIKKVDSKGCAFVTFASRADAVRAAEELYGQLIIKGQRVRLQWGKAQSQPAGPKPLDTSMMPPQVQMQMGAARPAAAPGPNFFGLPAEGAVVYPSMDPTLMGMAPMRPPDDRSRPGPNGSEPERKRMRAAAGPGPGPPMGPPTPMVPHPSMAPGWAGPPSGPYGDPGPPRPPPMHPPGSGMPPPMGPSPPGWMP